MSTVMAAVSTYPVGDFAEPFNLNDSKSIRKYQDILTNLSTAFKKDDLGWKDKNDRFKYFCYVLHLMGEGKISSPDKKGDFKVLKEGDVALTPEKQTNITLNQIINGLEMKYILNTTHVFRTHLIPMLYDLGLDGILLLSDGKKRWEGSFSTYDVTKDKALNEKLITGFALWKTTDNKELFPQTSIGYHLNYVLRIVERQEEEKAKGGAPKALSAPQVDDIISTKLFAFLTSLEKQDVGFSLQEVKSKEELFDPAKFGSIKGFILVPAKIKHALAQSSTEGKKEEPK